MRDKLVSGSYRVFMFCILGFCFVLLVYLVCGSRWFSACQMTVFFLRFFVFSCVRVFSLVCLLVCCLFVSMDAVILSPLFFFSFSLQILLYFPSFLFVLLSFYPLCFFFYYNLFSVVCV